MSANVDVAIEMDCLHGNSKCKPKTTTSTTAGYVQTTAAPTTTLSAEELEQQAMEACTDACKQVCREEENCSEKDGSEKKECKKGCKKTCNKSWQEGQCVAYPTLKAEKNCKKKYRKACNKDRKCKKQDDATKCLNKCKKQSRKSWKEGQCTEYVAPPAPPAEVVPAPPVVDAQAVCEADWKKACKKASKCGKLSGEEKKDCSKKCGRKSKKKAWQEGACTAYSQAPATPATQAKCPSPNVVVGKKCYYVHEVAQTLSYESGAKWCKDTGGEVASIRNNKQNNAVLGLLNGRSSYIGATRTCASTSDCTDWTWDDGSNWVEPSWATDGLNSNQNTYEGGETHIVIHSDRKWHDWARGEAIKDVVCQFKNTAAPPAPPMDALPAAPISDNIPAPPVVDAQAVCEADWKKACKKASKCGKLSGEEKKDCSKKCGRKSKKSAWQEGVCTGYVQPVKPMSLPETNCPTPEDARVCNFWGDPHFTHLFFSDRLYSDILLPGSVVTLKGGNGQKYCADDGDHGVRCNRGAIGAWEKFTVEDAGGGRVALRGGQNNKYCADEDHNGRIICNRDRIGGWEKFTIVDREDGTLALRGGKASRFCADEGERTICNRPHIGSWEQFTITVHQKGEEWRYDTPLGTGGRKHRTAKLVDFNPAGLFKLAESEDGNFEAQTFFCPAYGRTTTGVAVAMRFGEDVVQMVRGKATAPESDDPAHLKYFTKLSPREKEDKFMKFFVNGEPMTWDKLGSARGTRGQDVDDVGGGVPVGSSAFIQQMHTTLESGNSMLPVCVGDGKETIVEVSTPWFDDSNKKRVFENAVTVRMHKPAETGMCGDLPDGLKADGEKHRVKSSGSLFTTRQMKSLCDMCRLEQHDDTCGAPSHEQSAEQVCRAVKADYQAARESCLKDFEGDNDWVEACAMETCVGGPAGTVIAQLELQRELEGVSLE